MIHDYLQLTQAKIWRMSSARQFVQKSAIFARNQIRYIGSNWFFDKGKSLSLFIVNKILEIFISIEQLVIYLR